MASNTKLSKSDKHELKDNSTDFASTVHSFDFAYDKSRGITVFMVIPFNGSNVMRIATSIMSPEEKKFRKSVGRYNAFNNYINGKYIDTPCTVGMDVFNEVV